MPNTNYFTSSKIIDISPKYYKSQILKYPSIEVLFFLLGFRFEQEVLGALETLSDLWSSQNVFFGHELYTRKTQKPRKYK